MSKKNKEVKFSEIELIVASLEKNVYRALVLHRANNWLYKYEPFIFIISGGIFLLLGLTCPLMYIFTGITWPVKTLAVVCIITGMVAVVLYSIREFIAHKRKLKYKNTRWQIQPTEVTRTRTRFEPRRYERPRTRILVTYDRTKK